MMGRCKTATAWHQKTSVGKKIVANFFVGFGLLACLAKYLNLKENSPCFLLLFVFSFSRCTIPIWNAQLLWKLGLTLHLSAGFHQIYTSFDRLSRLPLAFEQKDFWHFSFWKLQVGTALEICIQVRKISWIFVSFWKLLDQVVRWPSGQVDQEDQVVQVVRCPGCQDAHSKENPTFVGWPRWPRLHLGSSKNSLFVPVSDFERLR